MQETISLYLELVPGEKADFEVVGRAAAAFAELVKEVSYILDPGAEVRLEFESGTEGSLSLNAIFKTLRSRDGQRGTLIGVIIGASVVFVQDARTWGVGRLLDYFFPSEHNETLSDEDLRRIADTCANVAAGKIAKAPVQELYRQLDRDQSIKSVGTITKSNTKPPNPVPREDFPLRAGVIQHIEQLPEKRTSKSTERLTVISPVLLNTDRAWRLRSPFGEFGYKMKDEKFLSDLLSGRRQVQMKEGIQITAEIDTHEKLEGGVWKPVDRDIMKVLTIHRSVRQSDLFSQPKKRNTRGKKKK